jgi:hypothetical protein
MKKKLWLVTILGLGLTVTAFASGSYNARPPRVPAGPAGERGIDNAKYELGKKIYNRKVKLNAQPSVDREAQERRLRELEARLPTRARGDVNLPTLAGMLSPSELEALEYYVSQRYPVK